MRHMIGLWVVVMGLLGACKGEEACTELVDVWVDDDGDGFGVGEASQGCAGPRLATQDGDCDDADPLSNPDARWYPDLDGDGFGDQASADVYTGCDNPPSGFIQAYGECDDTDPALNWQANGAACIQEHCGSIVESETWPGSLTHHVTCNVVVGGNGTPVLTVEAGSRVLVTPRMGLVIGDGETGTLRVEGVRGDEATEVVFSRLDPQQKGTEYWTGITIGPDSRDTEIAGADILYAGRRAGNRRAAVQINNAAPRLAGVTIQYSDTSGLYITGAASAPEIVDSAFLDNVMHGVHMEGAAGLARSSKGPTFVNNVLQGNGESSMVVPAAYLGELDPSCTLSNNGEPIAVLGGNTAGAVARGATWSRFDDPYRVQGNINIGGSLLPEVAIAGGTEMRFAGGTKLTAGVVGGGSNGALHIVADKASPVLMTSADKAVPGAWEGLEIGPNGALGRQTVLDGLVVENAGGSGGAAGAAIKIRDMGVCTAPAQTVTLRHVEVLDSSKYAIQLEDGVTVHAEGLLMQAANDGCFRVVTGNCPGPIVTEYVDNRCEGSPDFGDWPLTQVDELEPPPGSTYPAGGAVLVHDTRLLEDVVMPDLGVPFRFSRLLQIYDNSNPTLTVSAGTVLEFDGVAGFDVARTGANDFGGLVLEPGTRLTAAPGAAFWQGLRLRVRCGAIDIDGATIEYAGANLRGAVWVDKCLAGTLQNTTISNSDSCGVALDTTAITPTSMTYATNRTGDECTL